MFDTLKCWCAENKSVHCHDCTNQLFTIYIVNYSEFQKGLLTSEFDKEQSASQGMEYSLRLPRKFATFCLLY